jgi:hypothetical protein
MDRQMEGQAKLRLIVLISMRSQDIGNVQECWHDPFMR